MKNDLKGVMLNGLWCNDPIQVREEVRQVFEKRFIAPKKLNLNLQGIDFPTLSEDENMLLIKEIKDLEIEDVINQCEGNKSPNPDGFNFFFIKQNWDILKYDVC